MNSDIKQKIEQINRGEVPEGYKKTSIGIVPQEWENKKLSELLKFQNGVNADKEKYNSGIKMISVMDILSNRPIFYENIRGQVDIDEKTLSNYSVSYGDILFQRSSETVEDAGKSNVYLDKENTATYSGFVIRGKKISDYNPFYLNEILKTSGVRQQIIKYSAGSQHINVSQNSLSRVNVCLANQYEQNRIAEILSKWDEAIELQEKLIEKLELQKKALMQRLLTPKKDWKKVKLGDLAFMQSGGTPKSTVGKYYNGNIVWVSINDISSCGKYLSDSERKITVEGLNNSSARLFPKGTVLYAMYASIGKCCIALSECSTSQAILGITTNGNLNSEYLYYFLLHNQEKIVTQGQKGTQSNVNKEMVQNIKVDIPQTINQQITIVKILNSVDRYIDSQSEKLKVLKQQQKAMQQLLLTGIVRV